MPELVDGFGGNFLSRSRFAEDEDGVALALGDELDHLQRILHGAALADHGDGGGVVVEEVLLGGGVRAALAVVGRLADPGGDVVQLADVAFAHEAMRNAGAFILAMREWRRLQGGYHGDRRGIRTQVHSIEEAADVFRRDRSVEERQLGADRSDHVTRLGQIVGDEDLVRHFLGEFVDLCIFADDGNSSKSIHTTPMSLSIASFGIL